MVLMVGPDELVPGLDGWPNGLFSTMWWGPRKQPLTSPEIICNTKTFAYPQE